MMKTALVLSILFLLVSVGVFAQGPDPDAVLAQWDGGKITVADYIHWWERLSPNNRPELTTPEQRAEFLDNIINANVMLQVARAEGVDKDPNVTSFMHTRRSNALKERLFEEAVKGRIKVDEAEVKKFADRRLTQITASHIIVPTYQQARKMMDSLAAGVPFEDLATRYSTCPSAANGGMLGAVRWGDFSDRWSAEAFQLEPGQYSQPFEVDNGYAIIMVHDKTMLDPENREDEEAVARGTLARDAEFEERAAFVDSLRLAYNLFVDIDAVVDLCARYAQEMVASGITSKVISDDIVPPLTEREKELPMAGFRGRSFTYGNIVDMILAQPYVVRPVLDDPDEVLGFINRQLNDSLLVAEAEHRGIDKRPDVADDLEKAEQNRTISRFYRQMTLEAEVPDDTLRAFYEAHLDAYRAVPGNLGSKIVVNTREEADSILKELQEGASFADLAREHSIDVFTAPDGGEMGFYPTGKDPEFDGFFAQMQVGDMKIFRSMEGHVVLWLRARQEATDPLPYDQARSMVQRDVALRYGQVHFERWIAAKRKELNVTVNEALLPTINL
jgi:peptidyl-prolyl cis-trans isomerase C